MNIEQARAKLASVSNGTATKHPKVLISELCVVVKFLLDELDRVKSPPMTVLPKQFPPRFQPVRPDQPKPSLPSPVEPPIPPHPHRSPPIFDSIREHRKGNAGDVE